MELYDVVIPYKKNARSIQIQINQKTYDLIRNKDEENLFEIKLKLLKGDYEYTLIIEDWFGSKQEIKETITVPSAKNEKKGKNVKNAKKPTREVENSLEIPKKKVKLRKNFWRKHLTLLLTLLGIAISVFLWSLNTKRMIEMLTYASSKKFQMIDIILNYFLFILTVVGLHYSKLPKKMWIPCNSLVFAYQVLLDVIFKTDGISVVWNCNFGLVLTEYVRFQLDSTRLIVLGSSTILADVFYFIRDIWEKDLLNSLAHFLAICLGFIVGVIYFRLRSTKRKSVLSNRY
ncbi:hypothetical protein M0811_02595 [Anaeramoeba ignava]|uniref:Uncharacterized protein n=1 Tax=Anaeramoeba ignava TaxID=1746090 RepID=A0A9Q0R622_ANAIG|nr:hypothetical protein M0811_02595 [Anaeramoeba ignava]